MDFEFTTELDSKLSYTPCYNQYGKIAQMFDWDTEQKLLKMYGGIYKTEA
jgi:hypothetical protein